MHLFLLNSFLRQQTRASLVLLLLDLKLLMQLVTISQQHFDQIYLEMWEASVESQSWSRL